MNTCYLITPFLYIFFDKTLVVQFYVDNSVSNNLGMISLSPQSWFIAVTGVS